MNELFNKKTAGLLLIGVSGAALYDCISAAITVLFYATTIYQFAAFLTISLIISFLAVVGASVLVNYGVRLRNEVN